MVQPEKIRNNREFRERLEQVRPDAIVVVAYGRIIPKWMLELPRLGCINLHGSLLPKYRGAAPVQWAVANGDALTGVTTMRLDEGLDTGEMLLAREVAIGADETAVDLFSELATVGAELMVETLAGLAAGTLKGRKQDEAQATLAPILTREDGAIDFARTARQIYDRWRGFQPWPGAHTRLRGKNLIVHRMRVGAESGIEAGVLRVVGAEMAVGCGGGSSVRLRRGADGRQAADERGGVSARVSGEERREAGALSESARRGAVRGTGELCGGVLRRRGRRLRRRRRLRRFARRAQRHLRFLRWWAKARGTAMSCCTQRGRRRCRPEDRQSDDGAGDGRAALADCAGRAHAKLLARPEQRLAEPVALALRMGAFQLLHMDRIPAHAVLNESVEMCRAAGQPHAAGMVNAVLRKLAAEQSTFQNRDRGTRCMSRRRCLRRGWGIRCGWWSAGWRRMGARPHWRSASTDQQEPAAGAILCRRMAQLSAAGRCAADGRWIAAGGGDCGGSDAELTAHGARLGLLRRSGWKDADAGAAVGGRGDSGDGCERETDGADGGAASASSVCRSE